ncbi:tripartite tricarboxylate transporter TctB family protein [Rhodobaculum claviforme]|nr:tripartite tricarboxylate transporter TctB family protein [Rhodobaculum claviforme]
METHDHAARDRLRLRQRRQDAVFAVLMMVFAVVMAFVVIPAGVRVPASVAHLPLSPRFFPYVLVGMVFVFAAAIAVMSVIGPPPLPPDAEAAALRPRWPLRLAALLAVLAGWVVLPERVGMAPLAVVATIALLLVGGERRIWMLGAVGVVVPVLVYLLFTEVFHVPMPAGPLLERR